MLRNLKLKKKTIQLMPIRIDEEELLEKHKAIQTKIEDLKNIKL